MVRGQPQNCLLFKNGASGGTRTHYPQFRKLLLYPDELRRRAFFIGYLCRNFKRYFE